MSQKFTIGIEEEYQIIDPETRDLVSRAEDIYEPAKKELGEQVKAEMHQCMIEVGTNICADVHEARKDLYHLRSVMDSVAREKDLRIAAASTHPFGHWADQKISEHERYVKLVEDMQVLSRSLLIFGMHVHVAMEDKEMAIHISNAARYFLPHLLTLSTSSPFWRGIDTGLKSYRCEIFKRYPRTELPDYFSSYSEYDNFLKLLIKTNCIDDGKKIWWDLRLHPVYPTLEFRICDIPTRAEDSIAIAALIQAIVAKLYKLIKQNLGFRLYRRALLQENKWRALRYGIDGKLIDFGKQEEVPVKELIAELAEFVDDVLDDLGSRETVKHLFTILETGTSADRQLKLYQETKDFKKVVDHLIEETMADCRPASKTVAAGAAK
ncbi:carboxylate-amine ligase [Candidatus Obscuribacterales bacterium]|nr:carboxylate-amine ligase [Candidatus Obscuribacterales bacterium]MBX3149642.1 carboxylate-amine ligase [Candidatus Obscuribacterales bacterium]